MFVSTTGDAEQCSTIQNTWNALLSKSLAPHTTLPSLRFALFALGDRAYGPEAFCAAGRKLAARLVQLGGGVVCPLGYGDDGSPNGGVFADLDVWLVEQLFPALEKCGVVNPRSENGSGNGHNCSVPLMQDLPYIVEIDSTSTGRSNTSDCDVRDASLEWQHCEYRQFYNNYFQYSCPPTAYQYNNHCRRILRQENTPDPWHSSKTPLLGRVTTNDRITAPECMQDTRHLRIHVEQPMDPSPTATTNEQQQQSEQLPYQAGDIATILPSNPAHLVSRFLSVLPPSIQSIADTPIRIQQRKQKSHSNFQESSLNHPWPERCTLRGLLTHCADIQSLPEREDLYSLSVYCNQNHPQGKDQRDKLISLSETSGAALYGDYIIREKRNWVDLFYDFDAVRWEGSGTSGNVALMTISHLLTILPSIAPRHFSIASSPSYMVRQTAALESKEGFDVELCVAVVDHILERNGAVYIAGGSKMARAVREEIVEALGSVLEGGEGDAKKLLNKLKRKGMFSIEAWS